jgi:chromosome segregation ATPase
MEKKKEKEKKIKELIFQMNKIKQNLEEKEAIINNKNKEIDQMTEILEQIFQKEKELEEKEKALQKELEKYKNDAIRHFLIIRIINEEIEK